MRYSAPQYAKVLLSLASEVPQREARGTMREFFKTLANHGALSLLPEIVREVARLQNEEKHLREVTVRSAERESELSIKRKLHFPPAPGFGRASKAEVKAIKDVRVRGGAIVESGGLRVDNSLALRLKRLQNALCA